MLFKRFRRAYRGIRHALFVDGLRLPIKNCLDTPLDLADVVEISIDAGAVGGRKCCFQTERLFANRIADAAILLVPSEALLGGADVAKQLLEDRLRTILHG